MSPSYSTSRGRMDSLLLRSYAQQNKYAESYEKREATTLSKEEEDEACLAAMAITTGNAAFKVLKVVIELGVLEIMKNAGRSTYMSALFFLLSRILKLR
ncbi:hypothetical protein Ancab_008948 [Ancistrocladus abbreviatus]